MIAVIAGEMQRVDNSHCPIETSAGEARAQKTVATQHNEICFCLARAAGRAKQHTEASIVARRHPIKIDHQIDTRIGVGELHQRAMQQRKRAEVDLAAHMQDMGLAHHHLPYVEFHGRDPSGTPPIGRTWPSADLWRLEEHRGAAHQMHLGHERTHQRYVGAIGDGHRDRYVRVVCGC